MPGEEQVFGSVTSRMQSFSANFVRIENSNRVLNSLTICQPVMSLLREDLTFAGKVYAVSFLV